MKGSLRVVLMGAYSAHLLARELNLDMGTIQRVTSWNEILSYALADLPGIDVHFITLSTLADRRYTITIGNLKVTYLPAPKSSEMLTFYRNTRYQALRLLEEINPDIVHGIGTEHIWPSVAIASKRPAVITVHGFMTEIVRNAPQPFFSKRGIKQRLFSFMERHVLRKTRHLIAINPYVTDITSRYTSAKTYLVENPIRDCFFAANAQPGNGSYFLFVGGIEPLKGVNYLVEAMARLVPDSAAEKTPHLVIVGPDSNKAFAAELRKKISSLGLDSRITFKGFMFPEELAGVYSKAACLVLTSLQETAPMCIAEALSAGLPVIATRVGGIPNMVDNGRTGFLVPPKDPRKLADAMQMLWDSPELRMAMGKAGHLEAIKRWKPAAIAVRTLDVYRAVLSDTIRP